MKLIFPDYEEFDDSAIVIHREYWQDDDIWDVIKTYPPAIKMELQRLKECLNIFISKGFCARIKEEFSFNHKFLKEFYFQLSKTEDLEYSIFKAGVYERRFFYYYFCQFLCERHYRNHRREPVSSYKYYEPLRYLCIKGHFKKYGINSISEFLKMSLNDKLYYDSSDRMLSEDGGLIRVKKLFEEFYNAEGRVPFKQDPEINLIAKALKRGIWSDQGITSWSDLLWFVFEDRLPNWGIWRGYGALQLAKSRIHKYTVKFQCPPPSYLGDFSSIKCAIQKGSWKSYGIKTWKDLLEQSYISP